MDLNCVPIAQSLGELFRYHWNRYIDLSTSCVSCFFRKRIQDHLTHMQKCLDTMSLFVAICRTLPIAEDQKEALLNMLQGRKQQYDVIMRGGQPFQ